MDPSSTENTSTPSSTVMTAFIGNLRSDRFAQELEIELQSIFHSIGVFVALDNVKVHRKSSKRPAYAFAVLKDQATFDFVVEKLNGISSVNLKTLIFPGKKIEISAARRNLVDGEKHTIPLKNKKNRKHSKKTKHKTQNIGIIHGDISQTDTQLVVMGTGSVSMATSSITTATKSNTISTVTLEKDFVTLLPGERYYYIGQRLGTEDRLTEYKQGGGNYLDSHFKVHLAKYVCAFLNSEGGTLLVGVQDDCTVCGVKVSSKREDQLRLEIDNIMRGFNPPVFTRSYSIKFVPVFTSPVLPKTSETSHSADIIQLTTSTSTTGLDNSLNATHLPVKHTSVQNSTSFEAIPNSQSEKTGEKSNELANEKTSSQECHSISRNEQSTALNSANIETVSTIKGTNIINPNETENNFNDKSIQLSPAYTSKKIPSLKPSSSPTNHPDPGNLSRIQLDNCKVSKNDSWNENVNSTGDEIMANDLVKTGSFGDELDELIQSSGVSHNDNYSDDNMWKFEGYKAMKTDLKVIEVKVHPLHQGGDSLTLYENHKGEVYIRRDGSIQGPLKASQILAWSRQNIHNTHHLERTHFKQEIERKQGEIEMNMKLVGELVKQKQFIEDQHQEKIEKLKENENKLNAEINLLRSQDLEGQGELNQINRNKSKVCVLI